MKVISLDPRMNRIGLEVDAPSPTLNQSDSWITYEVFHQKKKGTQHQHVGIVHAASPDLALIAAKELFARRGQTSGLWVVKSSEVLSTSSDDEDIFESTPEKLHREASAYKVRDKIEEYKNREQDGK